MNAEVVWHGARWREYPAPIPAETLPPEPLAPPRYVPKKTHADSDARKVLEATTDEWRTVAGIAESAGVKVKQAGEYLARHLKRGRVERQEARDGRAWWVYRRRQG
jgi:predicted Rossmann fold nucleotide-binding protein DprA/Smf involved in DNA uptake